MTSHIIHVIVELDNGWMKEAQEAAIARIAENITEEVEANWGEYGAFRAERLPHPMVTGVQAIT
jgi:hypothetical protein